MDYPSFQNRTESLLFCAFSFQKQNFHCGQRHFHSLLHLLLARSNYCYQDQLSNKLDSTIDLVELNQVQASDMYHSDMPNYMKYEIGIIVWGVFGWGLKVLRIIAFVYAAINHGFVSYQVTPIA